METKAEKIKKISLGSLLEYVWVLILILEGNSVYRHLYYENYRLPQILIIATLILIIFKKKLYFYVKGFLVILGIVIYTFLYYLITRNSVSSSYLMLFVIGIPTFSYFIYIYYKQNDLFGILYKIRDVICIMAVISLIFWVLGSVFSIIPYNSEKIMFWGRK